MWDCADLNALREVFNLSLDTQEWALMVGGSDATAGGERVRVVHAAVLPDPPSGREKDVVREQRPLLGMLLESVDENEREHEAQSVFVVYSLQTHQVVKMRPMPGLASDFKANQNFIVIGTTTPPTLHILSSTSFHTLHMITAAHLEPYATPALSHTPSPSAISITNAISNTAQSTSVSLGLSIDTRAAHSAGAHDTTGGKATPDAPPDAPHPVFALHHRLLAFASPSPASSSSPSLRPTSSAGSNTSTAAAAAARRLSSSSAGSSNAASSLSSSPFALGRIAGVTQADVGHAALRVGESVFSGMRLLGGMALEAAKSRRGASASPGSAGGGRLVSRSAPDTDGAAPREDAGKERRYSHTATLPNPHLTTVAPSTRPVAESGHYVTVLDLAPLLGGPAGAAPTRVDEFNASRSRPVVDLSFAHDGTSVAAVLKDGHTVRVFKLQPAPRVLLHARAVALEAAAVGLDDIELRSEMGRRAAHVYDLYRGRTSAVVEGLDWARDGRWLAMGTRNRTIHVFAVNPYGGKGDVKSHMEGRVRNVDVIEPRLTTLHPLVRLRGTKSNAEQTRAPLAFTFISPADVASSPTLMFPFTPPPISHSPSFSPPKLKRAKNYQDLLVFDPVDGVLSLRRLAIDKHPEKEQGIGGVAASVHALGVTSISLPGMGGAGRLSSSPSTRGTAGALSSGRSTSSAKVEEPPMELVGKETVEATWDLKRGRDWVEIKTPVLPSTIRMDALRKNITGGDWLSEGEISTCSNSTTILPRSLYLSHQFSFHTLGEDYHALIRRYQFDISGAKIEVRKAVEISAYASGGGESAFVEGFSSPRDIRRASSSFDEPIASAISGSFDNSNLPTILPMYPNGVPGAKPKSFRNSIPIRTMSGIGDGVSEGIGRLRREMHKTRSPQLVARPDSLSGPVPLEFDEEDEDFISRDTLDASISHDASRKGASADSASSLATPANLSTHHLMDADVVGAMEEDIWDGWDRQDKLAVEEAEQFHDITAIGYVEEEQPQVAVVSDQVPVAKRKGRAKRRG
ncbi:hypothetical protein BJ912DRAFT_889225 [Pholiota molesta]|nr:hypothetical protein BJ912DRAFT_889225 [Pholiota molesta]